MFLSIPLFIYAVWYGLANTPYALKSTEWLSVMSHIWLVYFYVSLALRENILRVVSAVLDVRWSWSELELAALSSGYRQAGMS